MMAAITAIGAIGGLAFVLVSLLALASRIMYVAEDPRIDAVDEMLPQAHCGACGFPGCRLFAEALVTGTARPVQCTVGSDAGRSRIAAFLGIEVGVQEKRVARLACAGGANVARNHARYSGLMTCAAGTLVAGGGKGCFWGCLGLADCEAACDFDAIRMSPHGLPVVDEAACTACGDCVDACPKDLFSLHAVSHRLWVACRSQEEGDEMLSECEVACTACGRCAMDAPGLVTMAGNLPVVDYDRPHDSQVPIQRCPTGAIVWLDPVAGVVKGPEATRVIRHGALRDAST
jgi:Na+-translocating ferredoxin:NAD+ oxidoreductase RNF subunit RnfB